jgi:pimeloyl-ACP methyl ester carboxylesterase
LSCAALLLAIVAFANAQPPDTAPPATPSTETAAEGPSPLIGLLETYFRARDTRSQRDALAAVRSHDGVTFTEVADALTQVNLWDKRPSGVERVEVTIPRPGSRKPHVTVLHVRVPDDYDPARAYPLLLGFSDAKADPEQFVSFLATLLGDRRDDFLIASASDLGGVWFSDPAAAAGDPDAVLALLKRRYHLDTDRFLLIGYGTGGQAAFHLALIRPDAFAAAMPLAAACALETGAEAADLFLPNLRHLPVSAVYGALDVEGTPLPPTDGLDGATPLPGREGQGEGVQSGVAPWNRYMAARARRLNVPLHAHEIPDAGRDGVVPSPDVLASFLDARRPQAPREMSLRFRYPEQGSAHWLRQTRFTGDPWTAQHIVISPAEGESPEEAVTAVLTEKLAHLAGRVDGQTIHIDTHRCERIDVLLSDALLDLDQEVTIYVDGTQRFKAKSERSIDTLLEEARTQWDFQHPVPARLQVSKSGRAIEY